MSSIYVFSYFPFGFEGRIWDLIVSVPDHCLSFYFLNPASEACLMIPVSFHCFQLHLATLVVSEQRHILTQGI